MSSDTRERTPVQDKHKSPEPSARVDAHAPSSTVERRSVAADMRSPSLEQRGVEASKGDVVQNGDVSSVATTVREQESSEKPKVRELVSI